jgi:hypothetical protein
MAMKFADFDVMVESSLAQAPEQRVFVISSAGVAHASFKLDVLAEDFKRAQSAASSEGPQLVARRAFGALLFQGLFHGSTLKLWTETIGRIRGGQFAGVQLRLWFDNAALANLPWELLHDGEHFLATRADVSLTRFLPGSEAAALPAHAKIKVASVVWNPTQAPKFSPIEKPTIDQVRAAIAASPTMELSPPLDNVGVDTLQLALNEIHALHVLAHGLNGELVLSDGDGKPSTLTAEALATLFTGRQSLRLIVLASCHSGQVIDGNLFGSVATRLVKAGVPAVIAMQYPHVTTEAAVHFSKQFFRTLAEGHNVDVAVNAARQLLASNDLGGREWSSPVLYLGSRSAQLLNLVREDALAADWRQLQAAAEADADRQALERLQQRFQQLARSVGEERRFNQAIQALRAAERDFEPVVNLVRAAADNHRMLSVEQMDLAMTQWKAWRHNHGNDLIALQASVEAGGTGWDEFVAKIQATDQCVRDVAMKGLPVAIVATWEWLQQVTQALERHVQQGRENLFMEMQTTLGWLSSP